MRYLSKNDMNLDHAHARRTVAGAEPLTERTLDVARALLWQRLRPRRRGAPSFARECLLLGRVVDFYCAEAGLVVLVQARRRALREEDPRLRPLGKLGLKVVCLPESRIGSDLDGAAAEVLETLRLRLGSTARAYPPAVSLTRPARRH